MDRFGTDRRTFLQWLGGLLTLFSGRAEANQTEPHAPEIHRATRNTRLRALGVRRPRLPSRPAAWKSYPDAPRLALPAVDSSVAGAPLAEVVRSYEATSRFAEGELSFAALSRLLHWTNGVTGRSGQTLLRAAPSAGALYAGEVYVLAERVEGLDPGIYYYGVAKHELVVVRRVAALAEVDAALDPPGGFRGAAACILLSNVFGRYTWRYANRGYRYALIDTGHIAENLRLGARATGLGERQTRRFEDDRLDALLGLGEGEAVCALHAVGVAGPAAASPSRPSSLVEKQTVPGWIGAGGRPATERYHEATRLVPHPSGRAGHVPSDAAASGSAPSRPSGEALPLPRLSPAPDVGVGSAIRARRSPLSFREDPVSLEYVSFVLEMARRHGALEVTPGIDLYVAAHRVSDIAPGLYRYDGDRGLTPVASGDLSGAMVRACLGQRMAGSAAVGFLMVGRFGPVVAPLGDRRYRDLLIECGAVGQRIYLAAEALGLGARNLAAFVDDDLNDLLGFDGKSEAVLHLTMLGVEG